MQTDVHKFVDPGQRGGDISEFTEQRRDPWQAKIYNGKVELALKSIARLSKPTIALVKGYWTPEEEMLPDAIYDSEDYAEGVRAFLEKRRPIFRGR